MEMCELKDKVDSGLISEGTVLHAGWSARTGWRTTAMHVGALGGAV
jgi:hypothetical protein